MSTKASEEIAQAREAFREIKVKSVDKTAELLADKYKPKAVTPPQPEVDPEYEEHLEAQRRLDDLIAKRRTSNAIPQPIDEGKPDYSGAPDFVRNFLEKYT